MKKLYVWMAVLVVVLSSVFIYNKIEDKLARSCVEEFLQLSYNCGPENIEEVLKRQFEYYEMTMRQMCERNLPIDVEYIKETEQRMQLVSDIYMTVKKNTVGNSVVHAEFIVQFKDIYESEGVTEKMQLNITLVKDGIFDYRISDIR